MKVRIARAIAAALFILGLLAAGTAPYGDPDTQKARKTSYSVEAVDTLVQP
jgi:hypothetical protein